MVDAHTPVDGYAGRRPRVRGVEPTDPDVIPLTEPRLDDPIATTLLVERDGRPAGCRRRVAASSTRLSIGQAMTFRAPRPALRIVAGTGPLCPVLR